MLLKQNCSPEYLCFHKTQVFSEQKNQESIISMDFCPLTPLLPQYSSLSQAPFPGQETTRYNNVNPCKCWQARRFVPTRTYSVCILPLFSSLKVLFHISLLHAWKDPATETSSKFSCCLLLLLSHDLHWASLSQQATSPPVCSGSDLEISAPMHPGFITEMATIILAFTSVQPLIFRKLAGTQLSLRFLSIFQNVLKLVRTFNAVTDRAFVWVSFPWERRLELHLPAMLVRAL